ncbi:MAG: hypothetical protein JWQ38_2613 [Flavipsychrobacter sp.]|nr:hypothetical protein [Flavipsychrobacter sp.]
MKASHNEMSATINANTVVRILKQLKEKITLLFEPEEVEITFNVNGRKGSYTYTKVSRKQVA